jgi:hypothetical protein
MASATTDFARFTEQLKTALVDEEFAALESMMGSAFYIRYHGAEGVYITVSDAVTLLRDELGGAGPITFDETMDPAALVEGELAPADLPLIQTFFSTGWGASNADQAVVLVSASPDGGPYFGGLVYARGGFPDAVASTVTPGTSPTATATPVVLPTPNPAPRGPVINQTDFPSGSWYTFDEADGRGEHVEGGYRLQVFSWAKWQFLHSSQRKRVLR